jgi:hypothetical protein
MLLTIKPGRLFLAVAVLCVMAAVIETGVWLGWFCEREICALIGLEKP